MNILVTGTSGFIGSHLLKALIEKYGENNIVALTSKPINKCHYLLHNQYNFDADYFIRSGFANINTIIHAGAFTPKNSATSNNINLCNTNILSTERILSSNLPKLKKFIFLSTLDVYGQDKIITENSPINPTSLYGNSKLYCEKMVESWATNTHKICQILRIGHVYGEGEEAYQKIIPVTINKILRNQIIEKWGSGEDLRTFTHVSDVVKAIISSLELENYILPVNVTADKEISVGNLIEKIIKLSAKSCDIKNLNTNSPPRNLIFENSKLKQYLITPKKDFDEGLLEEIQYMKSLL